MTPVRPRVAEAPGDVEGDEVAGEGVDWNHAPGGPIKPHHHPTSYPDAVGNNPSGFASYLADFALADHRCMTKVEDSSAWLRWHWRETGEGRVTEGGTGKWSNDERRRRMNKQKVPMMDQQDGHGKAE